MHAFATRFHRLCGESGHRFQGVYHALLIEDGRTGSGARRLERAAKTRAPARPRAAVRRGQPPTRHPLGQNRAAHRLPPRLNRRKRVLPRHRPPRQISFPAAR